MKHTVLYGLMIFGMQAIAEPAPIILEENPLTTQQVIDRLKPTQAPPKMVMRGIKLHASDTQTVQTTHLNKEASPRTLSLVINFKFNSSRLSSAAQQQLKPLAEALSSDDLAELTFTLEGHTDARGSQGYNRWLSQRRAQSVKQFILDKKAMATERISTVGYGEDKLLKPQQPHSGLNRRVVVVAN